MKNLLLSLCILCSTISGFSQVYYKYQIIDAAEANKIYNATGGSTWTNQDHWPVVDSVTVGFETPTGVIFAFADTVILSHFPPAPDTVLVHLLIKKLYLLQNNLSGALPDFAMDSLKEANFSYNHLTKIGNIQAPALMSLDVSVNSIATLPVFSLPSLEFFYAFNSGINGALVQWNTPKLQSVYLSYNNITSVSTGLSYSQLKILNLEVNKIEGTLSQWGTPKLEYLNLGENNLSGVSSNLAYPNLYYFDLAGNEITGDLPNWNFPNLKDLRIHTNHFTGNIPDFAYPLMENFLANSNNLTGKIPDFNWPNLILFDVRNNQLSGALPNLNAPLLQSYLLSDNKLTGDIKYLNFPVLKSLRLNNNQLDGIIKSPIDLPELTYFELSGNKLKGEFANFNLPQVEFFNITDNDFSGAFPNADMPKLTYLKIEGNNFTRLPDFTGSAYLYHVSCRYNRFHFDDLLPYKNVGEFIYNQMQPIDMVATPVGDSILLSVNVRGEGNEYTWYKGVGNLVKMDTNDLMIYKTEKPEDYECQITNPLLPKLTLHSKLAQPVLPPCWNNGIFDICITGSNEGWESGDEDNQIQTTLPISINDFILFEGVFTLDTVDLVAKINGKFYIENIPLPGGNVGNFTLAQGEYELALAGSDGIITGFINDALSEYVPDIGGLEIQLENLQLVGGLNATGVSLAFKVSFDNITPSCGNTTGQTTEISIEGLKITSDGISVDGLEVGDLGIAPGFCLKKLLAKYDEDNDKLTFGLTILTPFIEVGGGLGFIGGEVDSISMKAELQNSIIPIAATGIGIIGCEGRINSITSPPWNMRFGGIFSAVLNDDLFRLTTSVEYIPPTELKVEAGDGKFFNPPFYDDWWLIEGGVYGSIDLKSYKMKLGGQIKLAPFMDGNDKKFMGSGLLDMSYTNTPGSFFGKFDGTLTVPKLTDRWPFDWLSTKVGLPYSASGNGILVYKPQTKFILGNVNFGGRLGDLQYRIELAKPYSDPDYFTITVVDGQVTPVHAATFDYTFIVPDQTTMAVVKATHTTELPLVALRQPDGTEISEAMPSANAELDKDIVAHKTFWTLYTPQPGLWTAAVEPDADINVYYFDKPSLFSINATQEPNGLHVSWDPSLFALSDSIDFFADDDQVNYDGVYMMTTSATTGGATIPNALFENQCTFNLQALAYQDQSLLTDYAEASFTNSLSSFGLPEDIVVHFNTQSLLIEASWTPSAHPNIAGYVIELVENGVSRVIGMPYSDQNTFTYQLDAYTGQKFVIYAYGAEGEVSCASREYELSTSAVEDMPDQLFTENLFVYPNPFTDICTIRITSSKDTEGTLRVFNSQGALLMTLPQVSLLKGVTEVPLSISEMPPGSYFITCHSENSVLTSQVILVK